MKSLIASTQFTLDAFRHLRSERRVRRDSTRHDALARFAPYRHFVWCLALAVTACVLLGYSLEAGAISIFDAILNEAEGQQARWFATMQALVKPTFMALGTLEICWAAAIWAFEKDNLNSFTVEVVKKLMTIGFFFVLLENAPDWIPRIFGTFEQVGLQVTGIPRNTLTTDNICTVGIDVALSMWTTVRTAAGLVMAVPTVIMGTMIPGVASIHELARAVVFLSMIAAAIIVVSHVIVAAQFFCLKVETVILFSTGAIFLAMGSSSWTREYVSKYLNYAVNAGVRLLVLIFILSITLGRLVKENGNVADLLNPTEIIELIAASILQAILAIKAPELAGALLSGGSGLTAGSASAAAGGAFRGIAASASMAMNAGKAAVNVAAAVKASATGKAGAGSTSSPPAGMGANAGGSQSGIGGLGASAGGKSAGGNPHAASSPDVANGVRGGGSGGQMNGPAVQGAGERTPGLAAKSGADRSSGTATPASDTSAASMRRSESTQSTAHRESSRASSGSAMSQQGRIAAPADASLSESTNTPMTSNGNRDSTGTPDSSGEARSASTTEGEQTVRPSSESLALSSSDNPARTATATHDAPSVLQATPLRKGTSTPSVSPSSQPREKQ